MALWTEVAVSDMRIPGYGGTYPTSYAATDDTWWLRNSTSSQNRRASLVQGRYATPTAFTTTNPDYAAELSYYAANDPIRSTTWTRIQYWNQLVLSGTYRNLHTAGWENNTRVMVWDAQLWVRSASTGLFTLRYSSNTPGGDVWTPNFGTPFAKESNNADWRIETSTGYPSMRLVSTPDNSSYYFWHGYGSVTAITGPDVSDVLVTTKAALVLDDPDAVDDRRFSRFMFNVGADYYPGTSLAVYPGVGTSRYKFVRAEYPNFQYFVMHTMTEAQFNATNGYPSVFNGLSEGDSVPGGGGGTDPPPSTTWLIQPPSKGQWFTKLDTGANNWSTHAVANTEPNKVRRGRRALYGTK